MILKNKRKHDLEKSDLLLYHLYNLGNPAFCIFQYNSRCEIVQKYC